MTNPLSRLWTDTATISRNTKVVDSDGITKYQLVVIASDVPCRISWNVKVPRTDATVVQRTDMECRLFFPLGTDILPGDLVMVVRNENGVVYTYDLQEISIPMLHSKHLEVNAKEAQKRA